MIKYSVSLLDLFYFFSSSSSQESTHSIFLVKSIFLMVKATLFIGPSQVGSSRSNAASNGRANVALADSGGCPGGTLQEEVSKMRTLPYK